MPVRQDIGPTSPTPNVTLLAPERYSIEWANVYFSFGRILAQIALSGIDKSPLF